MQIIAWGKKTISVLCRHIKISTVYKISSLSKKIKKLSNSCLQCPRNFRETFPVLRSIALARGRYKSCIMYENSQGRIGYVFVTDNMPFYVTALRHPYMSTAYHELPRFLLSFSLCLSLYFQVNIAENTFSSTLDLARSIYASIIITFHVRVYSCKLFQRNFY